MSAFVLLIKTDHREGRCEVKWRRIKPGQYELCDSDGTRWGMIERSSLMPSMWWWSTWGPYVDETGSTHTFVDAKRNATAAASMGGVHA